MYKILKILIVLNLLFLNQIVSQQSYSDGPIEVKIKLREVQGNFAATDEALLGIGFAPDELIFKIWTKDNLNIYPWTGGNCNQDFNFFPSIGGSNSIDFNSQFASFNFSNNIVPSSLDFKIDAWEDDLPSDAVGGFCNSGTACSWEDVECCGIFFLGFCVGIETGDDYRCNADPFFQGLDYRSGPPCEWFNHGYINGSGCVNGSSQSGAPNTNGYYKPRIETFWRYNKGNYFSNPISLGNLNIIPSTHFNSNECYTNYFNNSLGNDVIYSFNVSNPTGINISLCGVNGAQFDSYIYLIKDTLSLPIASNDNSCGLQSSLNVALCDTGTYFIVVDATNINEIGTFTLIINEDPTSSFKNLNFIDNVSCHGGSNAKILTEIQGGEPPYSFSWYDNNMILLRNQTNVNILSDSILNLFAGNYFIEIKDKNDCKIYDTINVNEPNKLLIVSNSVDVSCNGGSNGQSTIIANGGSPPYNFSWNTMPVQNSSTAVLLSAGNYKVNIIDDNLCQDSSLITINEPPPLNVNILNNSGQICPGGSLNLLASGANSYIWSPSTWLNTSIGSNVVSSPISSITYIVTGTDTNGCSNNDSILVDIIQPLSMSVYPPNPSVCIDDDAEITISTGILSNFSYSWYPNYGVTYIQSNTSSIVFSLSPPISTNYNFRVDYGVGCIDSISIPILVYPKPSLTISNNTTICSGSSVILNGSGTNNLIWYPSNSLNNNFGSSVIASPSISTSYYMIGEDINGCKDTLNTIVSVVPKPNINIYPSEVEICKGDSISLYISGAENYIWSPSQGILALSSDSVLVFSNNSLIYNVTAFDSLGCSNDTSIKVNVNPLPNITLNNLDSIICNGDISVINSYGASSYSWYSNSILFNNTGSSVSTQPSTNTTIFVTGIDTNNCSSSSSTNIIVNPLPNINLTSNLSTICNGDSVKLYVDGANNYSWVPSVSLSSSFGNIVNASPLLSTTYYVTGTDTNNCSNTVSKNIFVNPLPSLYIQPQNFSICSGDSAIINISGANSYYWSPNISLSNDTGSNVIAFPNISTKYNINGIDSNGCLNSINFNINVIQNPNISINASSTIICEGESVNLIASGLNQYYWQPSTSLSSNIGNFVTANPKFSTEYTLSGIDSSGCEGNLKITINVIPRPQANMDSNNYSLCRGDTAALKIDFLGNPPWKVDYSINSISQLTLTTSNNPYLLKAFSEGEYKILSVSDASGCNNSASGTASITLLNKPTTDFSFSPNSTNILEPKINFLNNSSFFDSLIWLFGDGSTNYFDLNPEHTYLDTGYFNVSLITFNQFCSDTLIKSIYISPLFEIYFPNIFTPNGDGINDCFQPKGIGINSYEIVIYNRWGQLVFESKDINNCWDGIMFNGKIAQSDLYTYIVYLRDDLGDNHKISGYFLLE